MTGCCYPPFMGTIPSLLRRKTVKARKEHECCECGDKISPGETYEDVFGVWAGRRKVFKTCRICVLIINDFFSCGYRFGEMGEDFLNCHGFSPFEVPE